MSGRFLIALVLIIFLPNSWAFECSILSHPDKGKAVLEEIRRNPIACSHQKVLLTFDDGPSTSTTPKIIEELNKRNVKGVFFISTHLLDESHPKKNVHSEIVNKTIKSGHLVAGHGHDHHAYDLRMNANGEILEKGYTESEREFQIKKNNELLNKATSNRFNNQEYKLFRFPYGRGAMPSKIEIDEMMKKGHFVSRTKDYAQNLK